MIFFHLVPDYQISESSTVLPLSYTLTVWKGNATTTHHANLSKLPMLITINENRLDLLKFQFHGPVRVLTSPYSQMFEHHHSETHVILQLAPVEKSVLHPNKKSSFHGDGIIQALLTVMLLFVLYFQSKRFRK
jgi:hypothetical protein